MGSICKSKNFGMSDGFMNSTTAASFVIQVAMGFKIHATVNKKINESHPTPWVN